MKNTGGGSGGEGSWRCPRDTQVKLSNTCKAQERGQGGIWLCEPPVPEDSWHLEWLRRPRARTGKAEAEAKDGAAEGAEQGAVLPHSLEKGGKDCRKGG